MDNIGDNLWKKTQPSPRISVSQAGFAFLVCMISALSFWISSRSFARNFAVGMRNLKNPFAESV